MKRAHALGGGLVLSAVLSHWGYAAAEDLPNSYAYVPGDQGREISMVLMRAGKGFYPSQLSKTPAQDCVSGKEVERQDGWDQVKLSTQLVSDISSLLEAQDVSVEAHVQSPVVTAKASYAAQRNRVSSRRNVSIIVKATQLGPAREYRDTGLTAAASQILSQRGVDAVVGECGSRFVKVERRGMSLSAIVTIVEASDELRESMQTEVSGRYGAAFLTASARAAFNKEVKTAQASARYEVEVQARGGPGLQALRELVVAAIRDKPSIDEVGKALGEYLAGADKANAVIVGAEVADIPLLGALARDPWTHSKGVRLGKLVEIYLELYDRSVVASRIAAGADARYSQLKAEELANWSRTATILNAAAVKILAVHRACMATTDPKLLACDLGNAGADVAAAKALFVPSEPYTPRSKFGVAIADSTGWKLMTNRESRAVFDSPALRDAPTIRRFNGAGDYVERFSARVLSVRPEASHAALVLLLDSENLESLAFRGVVNDVERKTIKVVDYATIQKRSDAPTQLFRVADPKLPFNHALILEVTALKGQGQPIPLPSIHWPIVSRWLTDLGYEVVKEADKGKGEIRLVAKDSYAGTATIQLMSFDWDTNSELGLRRLGFTMGTREPGDVVIVPDSSGRAAKFPIYQRSFTSDRFARPAAGYSYELLPTKDPLLGTAVFCGQGSGTMIAGGGSCGGDVRTELLASGAIAVTGSNPRVVRMMSGESLAATFTNLICNTSDVNKVPWTITIDVPIGFPYRTSDGKVRSGCAERP